MRFVVTESEEGELACEVGLLDCVRTALPVPPSIFEFRRRGPENRGQFNVALLVPTGIGAEIGGHAGDAGPVAALLSQCCDTLITHPNVVNASDINELPSNALYVEGSVLCRLLMGAAGLERVRSNRVLLVIDDHPDDLFTNAAVNAVNAARAAYGLDCAEVLKMSPTLRMRARFAGSGRASGRVERFAGLMAELETRRSEYDAVALSSVIDVPAEFHAEYFDREGEMVNPWGGVEAILTHAVSMLLEVPSAHSPMFESRDIANMDPGVVDARMAAEAVSLTFLQCILKGLHKSPRIVTNEPDLRSVGVLSAEDVSCLVIPDGCLGLPTIAALEQGISVITVRENKNLMRNDLSRLPWRRGQFHRVENYLEAAGLLSALKAGIVPESVRRPLRGVEVTVSGGSHADPRPTDTAGTSSAEASVLGPDADLGS